MSSDLVSNWGSRSGVSCVRRNEGRRNARAVPRRDRAHRTGRDRLVAPPRAVQREPGSRGSCGDPGEGAHRERGARTLSRTAGDASPWGGSHRRQARGAPGAGEGPAWQPGLRLFQEDQTRKSQTTPEEGGENEEQACTALRSAARTRGVSSSFWTSRPRWKIHSRSEEHTSELQSLTNLVCRLL